MYKYSIRIHYVQWQWPLVLFAGSLLWACLDQISTNYIPNSLFVGPIQQFWGLLYTVRVILGALRDLSKVVASKF